MNFDINNPRYTILPVPIKIDQTDINSEKKTPTNPIIVQIINPANGVARNFRLMNSIRCCSSVLVFMGLFGQFSIGFFKGFGKSSMSCEWFSSASTSRLCAVIYSVLNAGLLISSKQPAIGFSFGLLKNLFANSIAH